MRDPLLKYLTNLSFRYANRVNPAYGYYPLNLLANETRHTINRNN